MMANSRNKELSNTWRRVDPATGKVLPMGQLRASGGADGEFQYVLFARYDRAHHNQVVLFWVVGPNGRPLSERELNGRDEELPLEVFNKLVSLYVIMDGAGAKNIDNIILSKIAFTGLRELPVDELAAIGIEFRNLPNLHPKIVDIEEFANKALTSGVEIDGSNVVRNSFWGEGGVLALKALILLLSERGVSFHLYLDHSLYAWFKERGDEEGLKFLAWVYARYRRQVVTTDEAHSADELIIQWCEAKCSHIISRDEFTDAGVNWVIEAAEAGYPRIHKFYTYGTVLSIPDLQIEVDYMDYLDAA